mmetsp:Transcript_8414/g.13408  ORF Transcript_8414/g.13408 Transcript_8414/m.13408 type:complete len:239 (+) Transcript_8414:938-1654(+)
MRHVKANRSAMVTAGLGSEAAARRRSDSPHTVSNSTRMWRFRWTSTLTASPTATGCDGSPVDVTGRGHPSAPRAASSATGGIGAAAGTLLTFRSTLWRRKRKTLWRAMTPSSLPPRTTTPPPTTTPSPTTPTPPIPRDWTIPTPLSGPTSARGSSSAALLSAASPFWAWVSPCGTAINAQRCSNCRPTSKPPRSTPAPPPQVSRSPPSSRRVAHASYLPCPTTPRRRLPLRPRCAARL